jgi:hypothetical protein
MLTALKLLTTGPGPKLQLQRQQKTKKAHGKLTRSAAHEK